MTEEEKAKFIELLELTLLGRRVGVPYKLTPQDRSWCADLRKKHGEEYEEIIEPYKLEAEKLRRQREADGSWETYKQIQNET